MPLIVEGAAAGAHAPLELGADAGDRETGLAVRVGVEVDPQAVVLAGVDLGPEFEAQEEKTVIIQAEESQQA